MPQFQIETTVPVPVKQLAEDLLNMKGVNYELAPWLKMTAPSEWKACPIKEWPTNKVLFSSAILLFQIIPIDLHWFKLKESSEQGFVESSKSIFNSQWKHERTLSSHDTGATIIDKVSYTSRVGILGRLLLPLYRFIFRHRHQRLLRKYSVGL